MSSESNIATTGCSMEQQAPGGQQAIQTQGLIGGFTDINDFTQSMLRSLMSATKCSNDLPTAGDDFDYYSSFESFRHLMGLESHRLLQMIHRVMRYHGLKGNISANTELTELDDRFDVLVDANDQLLERVGTLLDEAAGLRKQEAPLVVVTKTQKAAISGSWNNNAVSTTTPSSSFRLLAAKNIVRPQLSFREKIDNSNGPFVPKIKVKQNAMKSLQDSLVCYMPGGMCDLDPSFTYPHPYQYELDSFVPHQLSRSEPQLPIDVSSTPLTYVDDVDALHNLCTLLATQQQIAIDLEHHGFRSFLGLTCLMQISTRTDDFIVDTLQLWDDMYLLNDVFTNPHIVKVLHGADMDIQWLQRDFGLYIVNMFDTGQASRVLNLPRFSLAHLLDHYCNVTADKQYQVADWRIRPLPAELLKYAREDTHYLLYIYDRMKQELQDRGNQHNNLLLSVLQRSTLICGKVYLKPVFSEDSYLEVYWMSRKTFNSQQLEALKGIYGWRDKVARQEDESLGYVLPNHMLMQMAEILPRELAGILACCNPVPPLVRQSLNELHAIIKHARDKPLHKTEATKPSVQPLLSTTPKLSRVQHDTSHQHLSRPQLPTSTGLSTTHSSMFNDDSTFHIVVQVCHMPQLSAFTPASQQVERMQKAAAIHSAFTNPFAQYLPSATAVKSSCQFNDSLNITPNQSATNLVTQPVWKLLPNTRRIKPEICNPVVSVLETPARIDVNPSSVIVENVALSVRQMLSSERKRRLEPHVDTLPVTPPVQTVTDMTDTESEVRTKRNKKKKRIVGEEEGDDTGTDIQSAATPFTPYDYSQVNYQQLFSGKRDCKHDKKSKRKKDYEQDQITSDIKAATKPRLSRPACNKSSTYNSKDVRAVPKIQWPKR